MSAKPKDFVERNSIRGGLALFRDWSAIILVSVFSIRENNFIVYALSVWVIGYFQFAIGEALLHEASHYNLFRKKQWNNNLEFLYALPFFLTISQFRSAHLKHHIRLGSEQDHIVKDYRQFGFFKPTKNIFWLWFVKPVIGYAGYYYVSSCSLLPRRSGIKIVVFWILAVFAFWYFGSLQYLLLYWIIPYVLSYCSFMYWSEVQDHYNARSGTRSNLSFLANLVTHNNGYHFTHHEYPAIPWYRLRDAHNALCPEGTDISYGFFDTYEQLKDVKEEEQICQRLPT
ncbi:MAG: hypothetical protein QOH63_2699 [Acidobacteriota bacterium]|jgi:fatty acid desaturase|nr:hypothetical protein [Acidobacteriota bacterium]